MKTCSASTIASTMAGTGSSQGSGNSGRPVPTSPFEPPVMPNALFVTAMRKISPNAIVTMHR